MAKKITSRPGLFGTVNHYDEKGKAVGNTKTSYDASGAIKSIEVNCIDSATSKDKLSNVPYPVISLSEQQNIANYLDKKCKEIDELISVKKDKIEKLKAYKKSVIYEYVTGKKQVI